MSYSKSTLSNFGKLIENELCEMFDPGSIIVIPFTESMAKDLCNKHGIDYELVAKEFRYYFTHCNINNSLCNLASCVFQVIIAYKCVASGIGAYNEEFSSFLGLSLAELQSIYSSDTALGYRLPRQEGLWISVKTYLKKHCGLDLQIPDQTKNSGRYVQYPRKQQLFSMGRYNYYERAFKNYGISHERIYTYKDFAERVFNNSTSVCSNEYLINFDRKRFEAIARYVIFYCFCNWAEREIRKYHKTPHKNIASQKSQKAEVYTIKLDLENKRFKLFLNNLQISNFEGHKLSLIESPFEYDDVFGDWVMTSRVAKDSDFGVCIRAEDERRFSSYLRGGVKYTFETDSSIYFYKLPKSNWRIIPSGWKQIDSYRKRLVGGLKDESGAWIQGLLPLVEMDNGSPKRHFFFDSVRIDFKSKYYDLNSKKILPGIHIIKFPDSVPIPFYVSEKSPLLAKQGGWFWDKKLPMFTNNSEEWMISGLNVQNISTTQISSEDRLWGNIYMEKIAKRFDRIRNTKK